MVRRIVPNASFELFNINSRGGDESSFGLTRSTVERANREADLIIVGGSNLYEGSLRWRWGVHLEPDALKNLRVPLFLLGIGSGSNFLSPMHQPSSRATREIKLLNDYARFSGARDVITHDWLRQLGISKAELTGDPATFIFNQPHRNSQEGHILLVMPPRRFWTSKRQFWSVHLRGRAMFRALVGLARQLQADGHKVVIACNDPLDVPLASSLFDGWLPGGVVCPETTEEYFQLLRASRAVVSGRLHTAVVAFSMGIPFLLLDSDQRTHGFVRTYQLEPWSISPSLRDMEARLREHTERVLCEGAGQLWQPFIEKRDEMCARSMEFLREALKLIS